MIGCFALGLAIGGFFDGIFLHQILQWHHLLSGIESRADDLRFQVMADGLFHLAMYVLLLCGLGLLWRPRRNSDISPLPTANAIASTFMGFGAWHLIDALLSHWLLDLHRIKMDSPNPLFWDLLWLAVFGIGPLLLGWQLLKRPPPGAGSRPAVLLFGLSAVAVGAAAASLLPAARGAPQAVLFAGTPRRAKSCKRSPLPTALSSRQMPAEPCGSSDLSLLCWLTSSIEAARSWSGGVPAAGCLTYSVPASARRV